jgi:hypothetical protein
MRAGNSTGRLLLVAPLGLFLGCYSGAGGTTASETGGQAAPAAAPLLRVAVSLLVG